MAFCEEQLQYATTAFVEVVSLAKMYNFEVCALVYTAQYCQFNLPRKI